MKVSPLRNLRFYFFLNDLDPDGCLVADQLRACTKTLESTGADKQKSLIPNWRLTLQKKDIIFCDGEVFSLDRGLLMGANIQNPVFLQISYEKRSIRQAKFRVRKQFY